MSHKSYSYIILSIVLGWTIVTQPWWGGPSQEELRAASEAKRESDLEFELRKRKALLDQDNNEAKRERDLEFELHKRKALLDQDTDEQLKRKALLDQNDIKNLKQQLFLLKSAGIECAGTLILASSIHGGPIQRLSSLVIGLALMHTGIAQYVDHEAIINNKSNPKDVPGTLEYMVSQLSKTVVVVKEKLQHLVNDK